MLTYQAVTANVTAVVKGIGRNGGHSD